MNSIKKYLLLIITCVLFSPFAKTQILPDSVIRLYSAGKTITDKRISLIRYINSIRSDPAFSAITTSLKGYLKSVNDEENIDYIQLRVNDQLAKTGNYITALSSSMDILDRFEKKHDRTGVMTAYQYLSAAYFYAGDFGRDVEYSKKAAVIAIEINNYEALSIIYNGLSTSYWKNNEPDSAVDYVTKAVAYAKKTNDPTVAARVLGTLGEAYILRKEYDKALLNIRQSLKDAKVENTLNFVWNWNDLAQIFLETNRLDSAQYYAHMAVKLSQTNRFNDQLQRGYEYLSNIFEKTKKYDSAFQYLQLAVMIKDSLYTSEKSNQVRGISDREQTRLQEIEKTRLELNTKIKTFSLLGVLAILGIITFFLFTNNRQKQKANKILESTLSNLKSTQTQLIQSEKMASLGELTAGIAHEIQNPLNFVNNFSEVNTELIDELSQEVNKGNLGEVKALAKDIKKNEQKINHHGKRAADIVKGMLQHSRASSGTKEPTDINALADEYLRLSYHGLRAKDKSFTATIKTDFDASLEKINILPQDIGRVILNLLTNAFYIVEEKKKSGIQPYEPTVSISTKKVGDEVFIKVTDNGNGIPKNIVDKIFQPFFTTKPTGQGTGLGLSMSYDIVTKVHGGELKVDTKEGEGSTFIISLPIV